MKKLAAVPLTALLVCSFALADTVDNPGSFTQTFDAGTLQISVLSPVDIFALTIQGDVDGDGNVTIPASGLVLPDITIGSPIGDITVRFVVLADPTGTLNPLTGEATITISLRIRLIHSLLPAGCGIGPIDATLTTGQDGDLIGVGYSMDDGTATYVNNTFGVPRSDGCGLFGSAIDSQLQLPSPPGNNRVDGLHGTTDPVFVGS